MSDLHQYVSYDEMPELLLGCTVFSHAL